VWGKLAVVLFYGFIIYNIVWLAPTIIDPAFGDGGCMFAVEDEYAKSLLAIWMQCMHLNIIGVLCFASRAGIQVWNVLSVLVVVGGSVCFHLSWRNGLSEANIDAYGTCIAPLINYFWIGLAWLMVTLSCAIAEERSSSFSRTATSAEQEPSTKA
jgi:hypothetical protein